MENFDFPGDKGSCPLLRWAGQNSLDESSEMHLPRSGIKDKPLYGNNHLTERAFNVFNMMRKEHLLCDVRLVADTVEVAAHKIVLAACSPYFHAMFTSFEESHQERVVLQGVDPDALQSLIDYVYTSEVHITEENVQVLLPAANLLQLSDVRGACCNFLQTQLHPTNCLGIKAFADFHGCIELFTHAENFIEEHFFQVVESEEFLSLSHEQVCKLIRSDRLTVQSEEQVYESVVNWVNHDLEARQRYLAELMEYVRLPLLSQEYLLQRVNEEPLIKANFQCKDYLNEALEYHLLKGDQRALFKTPRTKPRQLKVMLVGGGEEREATASFECYDFATETWSIVSKMPSMRIGGRLAVVGGSVYAVGGFNGSLNEGRVDVYDPATDVWTTCAPMKERRIELGVAVLNSAIYAVGGFDDGYGPDGLSSVEMFNPQSQEWKMVAAMSTGRRSVGVGVVHNLLYAVGGFAFHSGRCLSSVECYNFETDSWSPVPEMTVGRNGAGVGVLNGILYAVGGCCDGFVFLKSVEAYNPETKMWTPVSDMAHCRRHAGVVALNGHLYVVGGYDGTSFLSSVEVYDPKTNTWSMLPASMSIGRTHAGVVIIDKPATT